MACVGALRTFGAPAPLTLVVRPSFSKVSGSRMSDFRKALESWFDAQGMGILSGFNAHRTNSTARMGSYSGRSGWLSVLRQPAHHRAASKCHTPSVLWAACPAAVSSTSRGAKVPFAIGLLAQQRRRSSTGPRRLAHCFQTSKGASVQHHCSSNQGTFAVCSTPSTPRPSLTVRSRGRLHHRASCLRQTGAPYLCS